MVKIITLKEFLSKDLVNNFESSLKKKYNIELSLITKFAGIILSSIIIPEKERNKGIGTKVMNEIINFANKNDFIIALTPSSDFGGNKNKLIQFYKSFGFVDNKGRNKNFEFMETMIKNPN